MILERKKYISFPFVYCGHFEFKIRGPPEGGLEADTLYVVKGCEV